MIDKLLITPEDLAPYKDVSENLDLERFNTFVIDAQFADIRLFLGRKLYTALQADFDDTLKTFIDQRFIDLWDGVVVDDAQFYGIKGALVQYTYARLLDNIQLNITRAGVRKFDDEESEEATQSQIRDKVNSARSMALLYIADTRNYLNGSKLYPEWDVESTKNTSVDFFKV